MDIQRWQMRREFYSENLLPFVRYWVIPNANEAIIMCMSCLIYLALGKFIENLLQNSFYRPFMLHVLHSNCNTRAQHFLLLRKIKKEKRIREVYRLQLVFLLLFLFCFFRREGNVT